MNNNTSNASISLQVFCVYTIVVGIILMTIPHVGLGFVNIKMGDETWARLTGLLAFSLGIIAFLSAKNQVHIVIQYSIWLRYFSCFFIFTLALIGKFELPMLIFGAIDGAGATWTLIALKIDKSAK